MIAFVEKTGLMLTLQEVEGCQYVNMGRELALAIEGEDMTSTGFPIKVLDAVKDILNSNIQTDENGTHYVAITNYNILFEPVLKMNIGRLLDDFRKRMVVVLKIDRLPAGAVYFPFAGDNTYSIDLKNINYKMIA